MSDPADQVALFIRALPEPSEPMLVASLRKGDPLTHVRSEKSGTTARTFLAELDEYVAAQVAKAKADVLDEVRSLTWAWNEDETKDPAYALWLAAHTDTIAREAGLPRPVAAPSTTPTSEEH